MPMLYWLNIWEVIVSLLNDPNALGQPSFIQRRDIIATVLALIRGAWIYVCQHPDVNAESDERIIAGILYHEMWAEKRRRNIIGPPRIDDEAAARYSRSSIKPDGHIDFKLSYTWNEEEGYLGMECKKVSSTDKRLAREYVTEGIMRFTTGKYCPGHDWAAMLGFVIDGNTDGSIKLVRREIAKTRQKTRRKGRWVAERGFGSRSDLYRTRHQQQGQKSPMTILHLFLTIS